MRPPPPVLTLFPYTTLFRSDPCPLLEEHGGIWKFDENKPNQKLGDGTRYATGLRQMPAITWHDGSLYIVMNNRDSIDQRSEEHTSELQSRRDLVCRLLLEKT